MIYNLTGRWHTASKRRHKLTPSMVIKIRAAASAIASGSDREKARDVQAELLLYGVSIDAIRDVIARNSFAWID